MPKLKKQLHFDFEGRHHSGQFVKITKDMMNSPAWKSLNFRQRGLYLEIKAKYKPKYLNGVLESDNSKDISFTRAEAKKMGYGDANRTFPRDVDKLIECGFIDLVTPGSFTREPNIYGLSTRWQEFGKPGYDVPSKVKRPSRKNLHSEAASYLQ